MTDTLSSNSNPYDGTVNMADTLSSNPHDGTVTMADTLSSNPHDGTVNMIDTLSSNPHDGTVNMTDTLSSNPRDGTVNMFDTLSSNLHDGTVTMADTLSSNPYEPIFTAQEALFRTGATRAREWRLDQLARMERMVSENEAELQDAVKSDFKTASEEYVFETQTAIGEVAFQRRQLDDWMKPVKAPVPKLLAATGHRAVIYRDPYGVALIIGPSNGPLTLLLRPAIAALAAGNTCILTLSNALKHTSETLLRLIPRYFEEPAVAVVAGGREANTSLLELPFDFIFFTGSTKVGKVVAKAAAEHLTPVLLELGGQNPAIVDGTGNIADAARKIVWGAMAWGGQWCT